MEIYGMDKEKSGISFTEIMIVMAIIGIMTGIAIPNILEWLPAKRVNGAIRNLSADIQWTKMKAVSDNKNYVICFDTDKSVYSIYRSDTCNTKKPSEKRVNISAEYPGIIIDDVSFGNTNPYLVFNPTGRPSGAGHVYLIPKEDIGDKYLSTDGYKRTDRFRLIKVLTTGMVKIGDSSDK
ncbi:MAG: GspH/FimT family pseudopilin [Nitrospinae bacterium]|nr:GspH/FimT family pseudopilin [Nitrospinota bacterium]